MAACFEDGRDQELATLAGKLSARHAEAYAALIGLATAAPLIKLVRRESEL